MIVGPWAATFGALVPLHESHSASGLRRNYSCTPAVTRHNLIYIIKTLNYLNILIIQTHLTQL